jgi:hypothetical protein
VSLLRCLEGEPRARAWRLDRTLAAHATATYALPAER